MAARLDRTEFEEEFDWTVIGVTESAAGLLFRLSEGRRLGREEVGSGIRLDPDAMPSEEGDCRVLGRAATGGGIGAALKGSKSARSCDGGGLSRELWDGWVEEELEVPQSSGMV